MFAELPVQPDDPILQLMLEARQDSNPNTLDLTVGVYKDEHGRTPVMGAIKEAEQRRLDQEDTKAYLGIAGDTRFNALVTDLALGEQHPALSEQRAATVQTTGGSAALRIGAELINRLKPGGRIWVSDPTWGNHMPLLKSAGLDVASYPYYRVGEEGIDFKAMCDCLEGAKAGDAVLIQGGCHNPTGADLDFTQWQHLTELVARKGLLPFVDVAYHGLALGLDEDAQGYRHMAAQVPEMLLAYSCSKHFGLYRDRAGALIALGADARQSHAVLTNLMAITRALYSLPPAHGAWLVAEVLADSELHAQWLEELASMRERLTLIRRSLADALAAHTGSQRFEFLRHQSGMFSFLGIQPEEAEALREQHSVYVLRSGRINVAGLTLESLDYLAAALNEVIKTSEK